MHDNHNRELGMDNAGEEEEYVFMYARLRGVSCNNVPSQEKEHFCSSFFPSSHTAKWGSLWSFWRQFSLWQFRSVATETTTEDRPKNCQLWWPQFWINEAEEGVKQQPRQRQHRREKPRADGGKIKFVTS